MKQETKEKIAVFLSDIGAYLKKMPADILRRFKTLRIQLVISMLLIGLVPYSIAAVFVIGMYRDSSIDSAASNIISQAQLMNNEIVSSGYLTGTESDSIDVTLLTLTNAYSGRIIALNSELVIVKDTSGIDEGRTVIWENAVRALKGETLTHYDSENAVLTVTIPITQTAGDETEVVGALLINRSMDYMVQNMEDIQTAAIIGFVVFLIALLMVSVLLSRHAVKPMLDMEEDLKNRQNGGTQNPLEAGGFEEAKRLADQFNGYVERMEAVEASRQEFVSNVSHELKTPLTSMKVLADSLNGMEGAPVELYQDFMNDMSEEIDRETKIINDLLSLVKLDKSGVVMNIAHINMNDLLERLMKRLSPIAEKQQVELVLESYKPVYADVDETKLSLAISNLIENGIKYNNPGGWVHVSINADHQNFYLHVDDNGMGIPKDSLDRIFERFFRVDKSHSREIGGTGLGLAITQNSVQMHHGTITVTSDVGMGTSFNVMIPLNYIINKDGDVIVKLVEAEEEPAAAEKTPEQAEEMPEQTEEMPEAAPETELSIQEDEEEFFAEASEPDFSDTIQEENPESPMSAEDENLAFDFDFPTEEEIDALMREGAFEDEDDE